MRVICVTLQDFSNGSAEDIGKVMDIGDEFTVVGELIGYGKGNETFPCYDLEPFAHTEYVFDQRNFATLPDNTADEMAEEAREAIVNLESVLA